MIYPNISKTPEYRVSIPTLNGGLNTADGVSFVEDNQLTECKNFWWKDGALRTRPGVVSVEDNPKLITIGEGVSAEYTSGDIYLEDGRIGKFTAMIVPNESHSRQYLLTYLHDSQGNRTLQEVIMYTGNFPQSVCFFPGNTIGETEIYMMVGYQYGGDIYKLGKDENDTSVWIKLNREDYYTPLVIINGKGNRYASLPSSESASYAPASTLEGFNMLNNVFSASFTADSVSWAFELPDMEYVPDIPVEATYTNHEGREYKFIASSYVSETGISTSARQWVNMLVSDQDNPRYWPDEYKLEKYVWLETELWKKREGYSGEQFETKDVSIHMKIDWFRKRIEFVRTIAYPEIFHIPGRMGRGPANNIRVKAPGHSGQSTFIRKSFTSDGDAYQFKLSDYPLSNLPGDTIRVEYYIDAINDTERKKKMEWFIYSGETETNAGYLIKEVLVEGTSGDNAEYESQRIVTNHYTIKVDRDNATVSFCNQNGNEYSPINEAGSDDIVISAYTVGTEASVYRMNKAVWFGGQAGGLTKGSRLFMTGDTVKPNLVYWSDLNNPLYFPEDSYAYIGDAAQPVTAFGKQSEMLVFFKSNEIYYTTYVEGESYSAEDVLAGKVVDIASQSAVFPVYQIHPTIGCDCPDTLQLCDNRLVWAHSSGKVCALTSASPFSERNVSVVSRMIERKLKQCDLQHASSADWQGYYVLFADRLEKSFTGTTVSTDRIPSAFLMDYSCPGFQIAASGGEYQQSRPVVWYQWELPFSGEKIVCDGNWLSGARHIEVSGSGISPRIYQSNWVFGSQLFDNSDGQPYSLTQKVKNAVFYEGLDYYHKIIIQSSTVEFDWNIEYIDSKLRTKLFDFGKPERIKNVTSIFADIGCNRDYRVSFMSERGETPELKYGGLFSDKGSTEPGYLQCVKIIPSAPRVRRFGIGVSTSGAAAFSGLSLKYKVMGV